MTQDITRLSFLLAATAISGCSFDPTGVSTGAVIQVACATDDECPPGFACEVEEEHGVTTSFCRAQDGSDECPAGFEVEIEHGQVLCQPHGGDDGRAGDDDVQGDECTVNADCPAGLECEHGLCALHGGAGDEPGDDGGAGAEPGDDDGGAGAEPGDDDGGAGEPGDDDGGAAGEAGDDDGGAGDDAADIGEDEAGDACAVDADCGAGSECEHGSCVPDLGHGGRDDGAR